MSRCRVVVVALALAGCTGPTHTRTGYAADAIYHDEIQACLDKVDCATLCIDVFQLDPTDTIDRVKLITHDQYGAKVACEFAGATEDFSLDVSWDDWGDDQCDGDCGDDGSWDDGSGDGSADDGSSGDGGGSDDGSGDGSDDSGGDGGSGRVAPHRVHVTPTSSR